MWRLRQYRSEWTIIHLMKDKLRLGPVPVNRQFQPMVNIPPGLYLPRWFRFVFVSYLISVEFFPFLGHEYSFFDEIADARIANCCRVPAVGISLSSSSVILSSSFSSHPSP